MTEFERYDPPSFQRIFIQDDASLTAFVDEIATVDAIGVDLEMVQRVQRREGGFQEWGHVLALIQIASSSVSAVIDPLRCADLSPLAPLMRGNVRKVFLGGGQDVALLERENFPTRNIVDVGEVALALYGRREDGMAALARRIFNVSLDKTVRRADWAARPVNPALLTYAHQDAELTLLIYRWFTRNYPDVLAFHERAELDPSLPLSTPDWLREAVQRSSTEPRVVVVGHGLDPDTDAETLAQSVRVGLEHATAPRQINRLLRVAADLRLHSLLPTILPLAASRSPLIRASAARAVGTLAEPDSGTDILDILRQDPIEDVRKAAETASRELNAPKIPAAEEDSEEESSLNQDALSALQLLRRQLEAPD